MSSCPGLTLEAFLLWNYNITVQDGEEANVSVGIAEVLGTIKPRDHLTHDQLRTLSVIFEPFREDVERTLENFDEEKQSWRGYAGACFGFIPDIVYTEGQIYIQALRVLPH